MSSTNSSLPSERPTITEIEFSDVSSTTVSSFLSTIEIRPQNCISRRSILSLKSDVSEKDGRFELVEDAEFENDRGVTKAVDTTSSATVMIKWIKVTGLKSINAAKKEADKLRSLSVQCQFIVQFIDFLPKVKPGWWEWSYFSLIIMECCPGGSLKDWVNARKKQGRRTTVEEASVIAAQLALALSFCHSRKIAHLDVKPANIMVMSDRYTVTNHQTFQIKNIKLR